MANNIISQSGSSEPKTPPPWIIEILKSNQMLLARFVAAGMEIYPEQTRPLFNELFNLVMAEPSEITRSQPRPNDTTRPQPRPDEIIHNSDNDFWEHRFFCKQVFHQINGILREAAKQQRDTNGEGQS